MEKQFNPEYLLDIYIGSLIADNESNEAILFNYSKQTIEKIKRELMKGAVLLETEVEVAETYIASLEIKNAIMISVCRFFAQCGFNVGVDMNDKEIIYTVSWDIFEME